MRIKPRIASFEDLTPPARVDRRDDLVRAEQNLDKQEHVLRIYPLDWFYGRA